MSHPPGEPSCSGCNWENHVVNEELNALEIYLLFTCIDALVGSGYRDFLSWVEARPSVICLEKKEVAELYESYLEEHGIGRNLRRAFQGLPPILQDWLAEHIDLTPREGAEELSRDDFLKALQLYFYEIRRNLFTHQALTVRAVAARDVGSVSSDWWTHAVGLQDFRLSMKKSTTWSLSYRQGLDEALILRLILLALALERLGIDLTDDILESNIRMHRRVHTFHMFFQELDHNSHLLELWGRTRDGGSASLAWTAALKGVRRTTPTGMPVATKRRLLCTVRAL